MVLSLEKVASQPILPNPQGFNDRVILPYGCTVEHIRLAMSGYVEFLGLINGQLCKRRMKRLESFLMPANFSSIVGEFMHMSIPRYCKGLVKNRYHNGHPDLLPAHRFPNDSAQHATEGIEIKASRYLSGWQGHNPENTWLMVFVFDSNRPADETAGIDPKPFRFVTVVGALLEAHDWLFSGRSETSRRTITASVTASGYQKMVQNWIYKDPAIAL
ncbi:MAG: hypothetical protein AB1473_04965 [Thermodesulfobacteriota bacterium]